MRKRLMASGSLLLVAGLALAGCSSAGKAAEGKDGTTELTYWLWNPAEQAEQQTCVDMFVKENPKIKVTIEQTGWQDYWTNLTTNMTAGSAPDVITLSSIYLGQYANQGQLLPLDDLAKESGVDLGSYTNNLGTLFVGEDGQTYGLPKEWSSYAIFYNKKIAEEAGVTPEELATMTWNPKDGGTFEQVLAKLSVDKNGVRGDQPGFDPKNVATFGLGLNSAGDALGDVQWSTYALASGWTYSDKNPWGTKFNYSDQRFKDTIEWYRGLIKKGYMPTLEAALSSVSTQESYAQGKYAMITEGSFNTTVYYEQMGDVESGIVSNPVGPEGKRASVIGSNAISVWAGSKHQDEAWKLAKFLDSTTCQNEIAKVGTVMPSRPESSQVAADSLKAKGIDMTPFTVYDKEGIAQLNPVADHWSDITSIMNPVMEGIMSFKIDVDALDKADAEINALFG